MSADVSDPGTVDLPAGACISGTWGRESLGEGNAAEAACRGDCCDPCGDRRVCRISGRYDTGRMVGFFFLAGSNGREDGVDSCVPKGEQNRGRNELFLSDREMPDLVQSVDIRYDHNGIGDEELCAELSGKRKAWW